MSSPKKHAIVIGGGMAGLMAANVLAQHFEQVSLIERDHYPQNPVFRSGVPQGHHLHVLHLQGQRVLEELFPGILKSLVAHGAVVYDYMQDICTHYPSGWAPQMPSSLNYCFCSRLLLEWQVRQEMRKFEHVRVIEGQEVVSLLATYDQQVVTGVRMRARNGFAPVENELTNLTADLVVDTSGRESHALQWLESLGYVAPNETVVKSFLGVATRIYYESSLIFGDPVKPLWEKNKGKSKKRRGWTS
jgi:2-polyprenyl-6-methoxyphenol hydroxylase-like FAD-dependent oxidoreductase